MPPKAAAPPVGSGRPVSANDTAISCVEAAAQSAAASEDLWRQRKENSTAECLKNYIHTTIIEACVQGCERLISDLDRSVERIVPSRGDAETKEDAKGAKKKEGASTPPPACYKPSDINEMTMLLLRFYRFDSGVVRKGSAAPALVALLKKAARAAASELDVESVVSKPVPSRGKTILAAMDVSKMAIDQPEAAPPSALPCPPGVDAAVWADLLQFRSKRLQVQEAMAFLEQEREPLVKRQQGIASISDLTDYALNAISQKRVQLASDLKEKEAIRSSENAQWSDKQKAAAPPGKK